MLIFIWRLISIPLIFLKYLVKNTYIDEFGAQQELDNPARLRFVFEDLGGVFMKFGQILAMRFDILPMSYAEALLNLLDNAHTVENDKMFDVFFNETGEDIREVFENLDETPISTASFAQVYKGTHEGEIVVIKIQKPDVEKYISSDLILLSFFAYIIDIVGILKAVSVKEIVSQLKEWVGNELNYTIEACNAQTIYDHAKKHDLENVIIPKIYHEFTTERIIVQEFLDGFQVNKIIKGLMIDRDGTIKMLEKNDIDLLEVSKLFIRDIMRQYFIDGIFHADPHPANLMLLSGNKIGYVDFGIIGKLKYNNLELLRYIKGASELEFSEAAKGMVNFIGIRAKQELGSILEKPKMKKFYDIIMEFITERLTDDFKPIINDWHFNTGNKALDLKDRSSAVIFLKTVKTIEKYYMKFPSDVIAFMRALLILDMVCLKMTDEFDMIKAINLFFGSYTLERAQRMSSSHIEEMDRIHGIKNIAAREEYIKEREYNVRERFIDIAYALAERYPELYNKIKKIRI